MKKIISLFIASAYWVLCPLSLPAAELQGRHFADELEFRDAKFQLRGLGIKTYLFVKVFVAGFYSKKDISGTEVAGDVRKRLEVAYFYPIPGKKLAQETRKRIILNTSPEEYQNIKKRVDVMDAYFVNLKPGDRYALTYIPQKGTYFTYNGQEAGVIEGYDFAKALFAVWIGEKPISEHLKSEFLGN